MSKRRHRKALPARVGRKANIGIPYKHQIFTGKRQPWVNQRSSSRGRNV